MTQSLRALVATRKGLFVLERSSGQWAISQTHFLGEPVSMVLADPRDGSCYAALNLGHFGAKLHCLDPGAIIWTEVAAPSYPPQSESEREGDVAWSLKLMWSLACGGADQPGVLWAGTLPGGLFRSDDRGHSWQLMRSLWDRPERKAWMGGGYEVAGIHSICVDPRDSAHVLLGVSCGGAWVTRDGGATWALSAKGMRAGFMPPEQADDENAQDPHLIVRCTAEPDVLWCQHHCGIWRSVDGGQQWTEVTDVPESNFGFTVAVHPRDGNTAWFVPAVADQKRVPVNAALSVTRTTDGGKSFSVLRNGLPQHHAYDLVYRHGLAVADDGRTLVMGSTSGGVWMSDDGGDHWATVSLNLPPVYAVAFA